MEPLKKSKNLLSSLLEKDFKKIRRQGFTLDNEEVEIGLFCVAAPIGNYSGSVIAAVSISGPGVRLTRSKIKELIPLVIKTAADISVDLGIAYRKRSMSWREHAGFDYGPRA